MATRILNCASMSPWWPRWDIGATCLLVDTDHGPVLVDTGLGLHDHLAPSRLVRFFRRDFGIIYAPDECAVRQVNRMGIHPEDIGHIVLTHAHFDHAGGLPDFPWAKVHIHQREYEAIQHPARLIERFAFDPLDFKHRPEWICYAGPVEKWFDFDAIPLPFSPQMYLVPLFGHTSGHCGVVVETGSGWIFQAGDALPLNAQFGITPGWLNRMVLGRHEPRLHQFSTVHPEVRLLAGHSWKTFFDAANE